MQRKLSTPFDCATLKITRQNCDASHISAAQIIIYWIHTNCSVNYNLAFMWNSVCDSRKKEDEFKVNVTRVNSASPRDDWNSRSGNSKFRVFVERGHVFVFKVSNIKRDICVSWRLANVNHGRILQNGPVCHRAFFGELQEFLRSDSSISTNSDELETRFFPYGREMDASW